MPGSPDWFEYVAARDLGTLLGLWLRFFLWPVRALFRLLLGKRKPVRPLH
jgi:hypothetical protein